MEGPFVSADQGGLELSPTAQHVQPFELSLAIDVLSIMRRLSYSQLSPQRGATLIEALISILIMSIGLLGIAGIQLSAISYQKSSVSMHKVAELSTDIAERIRSNPAGASNNSYIYNADYATAKTAAPANNNCKNSSVFCSTAQIASDDVTALLIRAQTALPQGAVRLENNPPTGYILTVMYLDKDFVSSTGTLLASTTCSTGSSGIDWRNCCPAAASVPNGVRCRRMNIIP